MRLSSLSLVLVWATMGTLPVAAQMLLTPQTAPSASMPLAPLQPAKPKIKRAYKAEDQKKQIETALQNDQFPKRIDSEDFRDRFFDGKPVYSRALGGGEYTLTFYPKTAREKTGRAERIERKSGKVTTGTWRLKGEGYCSRWNKGAEDCFTAVQDGGIVKIVRNTRAIAVWSREEPNKTP